MALGLFWLFKHLNFNTYEKQFYERWKENVPLIIWKVASIFDSTEEATKCPLILPFSLNNNIKKNDFFNPATALNNISSRLRDTIDNSLVDYYIEKRGVRSDNTEHYLFKFNYVKNIVELLNSKKIELKHFLIWIYKFYKIEIDSSEALTSEEFYHILKKKFLLEFNITEQEKNLFFSENLKTIDSADEEISGRYVRSLLVFDSTVVFEFKSKHGLLFSNSDIITVALNETNRLKMYIENNPSSDYLIKSLEVKGQIIIYGAPGTGKTFMVKHDIAPAYDEVYTVQFHPSTGYEDFIGGIFLDKDGKTFTNPGILLKAVERANELSGKGKVLLFIDEINRGNISNILGEAIMALDREYEVLLIGIAFVKDKYRLKIPDNLHIIGTMNSSDKSISIEDKAILRRFHKVRTYVNYEILEKCTDSSAINNFNVSGFLKKLNYRIFQEIRDVDLQIGHAYFMPDQIFDETSKKYIWDKETFVAVFNNSIIPLIEEYTIGSPELYSKILGSDYFTRIYEYDPLFDEVLTKVMESV